MVRNIVAIAVVQLAAVVTLVVSYMRIVVGSRFAFLEIAAAQLVYLVGFSYASSLTDSPGLR